MFNLGASEILLVAVAVLVLFGSKRIPEMMNGLGRGIREFKKATREIEEDLTSAIKDTTSEKKATETKPSDNKPS